MLSTIDVPSGWNVHWSIYNTHFDGFSLPPEVLRRCSHDCAAYCSSLYSSGEFEFVLSFVVTKFRESSTNTNMCVSYLLSLFEFVDCHPGDVSSIVLMIGTLMKINSFPVDPLPWPDPWIGYC